MALKIKYQGVDLVFESVPSAADLAARYQEWQSEQSRQRRKRSAITPREVDGPAPLSSGQRSMWFMQQMYPQSVGYVYPQAVQIEGVLEAEVFRRALTDLVRRHEILRTTFHERDSEPVQVVGPAPDELVWNYHDVSDCEDPDERARELVREKAKRPFELRTEEPFRVSLLKLRETSHVLLIVYHHIAADEWTTGLVVDELPRLYDAFIQGKAPELPLPPVQCADYAVWEQERLRSDEFVTGIEFWKERLAGVDDTLELPGTIATNEAPGQAGVVEFEWGSDVFAALKRTARGSSTTEFVTLSALFAAFLARWAGRERVVFGTPITLRGKRELQRVAGMLINTIPVASKVDLSKSFADWLGEARDNWDSSLAHQWVPLDEIVRAAGVPRTAGRLPLVDINFTYVPRAWGEGKYGDLTFREFQFGPRLELGGGLTAFLSGHGEQLSGYFDFDSTRFNARVMGGMVASFRLFVEGCLNEPEVPLLAHPLLAEQERTRLIEDWARGPRLDTPPLAVHQLFEQQVRADGARTALIHADGNWSYAQLNQAANAIARELREHGVGPEVVVGVSLERSPQLLAALLGVLKAGGAYLALQPDLPAERLEYMASDSAARLVLCDARGEDAGDWKVPVIRVDAKEFGCEAEDLGSDIDPESLAYILYTSGSTGRPKGVEMRHGPVANLVAAVQSRELCEPDDVVLWKTPYGFDVSVSELFNTLAVGASLVVSAPGTERDAEAIVRVIQQHGVTSLRLVPTALEMLVNTPSFSTCSSVRRVIAAGEALTGSVARTFFALSDGDLFNLLGPTEACVYATFLRCEPGDDAALVGVGEPLDNYRTYVLDEALEPVSPTVRGELYIGGDGLARGYRAMPSRTALSFVPDPHTNERGARMYRTGDVVAWTDAGRLEYVGRADNQLQVRGIRVELLEVETLLATVPGVRSAAVRAVAECAGRADALIAYLVFEEGRDRTPGELRAELKRHLAEAVIPTRFVQLDQMPRTSSGKIDRNALPEPDDSLRTHTRVQPRTQTEQAVAALWCVRLGLEQVGVDENFFEIGGHSLLAVRLQHDVSNAFGVEVPLAKLVGAPTVAELAALVDRATEEPDGGLIGRHDYGDETPLSSHQRRMWFLQALHPESMAYQVPLPIRIRGDLQTGAMQAALQELTARHEILRTIYPERDGEPIQKILPAPQAVSWRSENMAEAEDPASAALDFVMQQVREPFALRTEISLRAAHVELGPRDHVLLLLFHHIAIDEWTTNVLIDELSELYRAQVEHREHELSEPPLQYADYAIWQIERLESGDTSGLDFWSEHLEDAPHGVEWPVPHGPSTQHHGALALGFRIDATTSDALRALARKHKVSEFIALYAAFSGYLARCTGQRDLVVGVPVTMRDRQELRSLVGFVLNTLPLRSRVAPNVGFESWIASVQSTWLETLPHHEVPLDAITHRVQSESRSGGASPFDTMFTFVPGGREQTSFAGLEASEFALSGPLQAKVALNVSMASGVDGFEGVFEYDTAVFPRTAIEALVRGFERFLASCVDSPDRAMIAHPVSSDDHQSLVREWSAGARLDTPTMAVHQLFEQQVRADGARTALIHADGNWSYAQLNHAANVIARELREHGVGPEVVVGVSLERSPQLLAALLGVLKAGGAYLALQPDLPAERLEYMAADSSARLVLCDGSGEDAGKWNVPVMHIDAIDLDRESEDLELDIDPESLVYILYTSGSTGRPKGVEMRHGPVTNLVAALQERALFTRDDVVLWKTPYGFDVSVSELFNTLAVGARLVVSEPGLERDVEALTAAIRTHQVTVLRMVSTALEMLVNATSFEQCSSVRRVICAGEALSGVVARTYLERGGGELYNLLGATETCVDTTFFQFEAEDGSAMVSVGTPLENYRTYVLDNALALSAAELRGELYVGGAGLARGYRAMPSKTALSFVPDPHTETPGARMYRTGDVVTWTASGRLEYVGRADNQLQVRGIRVELLEVETLLAAVPGVRSAAVRAVNESSGRADALIAYLVFEEGRERTPLDLRSELKRNLAEAVIPTRFVQLDQMPRTSSGKIDRNALPEPDDSLRTHTRVQPRTQTEQAVAALWCVRLGLEQVGVDEDFFEIGGHSLLAVRLQHDVSNAFGVEVPLAKLVGAPTVAELAALVDRATEEPGGGMIGRHDYGDEAPLSSHQRRMWFLQALHPESMAYQVPLPIRIRGDLQTGAMQAALQELTARHEILRTIYPERDGEPIQKILPAPQAVSWRSENMAGAEEPASAALDFVMQQVREPFALRTEISLRAAHVELGPRDHVLLLLFHHIAIDEWTTNVLIDELSELYRAQVEHREHELSEPTLQYADYAIWQIERLESGDTSELDFWSEHLEDAPHGVEWPVPHGPSTQHHGALALGFRIDATTSDALRALARKHKVSEFIALYAAFSGYLARCTGQRDLVVGVPVTMRDRQELRSLVGFVLNTLPLRSRVAPNVGFESWITSVQSTWLETLPHHEVPLDAITHRVQSESRSGGASPFDTMFTFVPGGREQTSFAGLEASEFALSGPLQAKVALNVSMASGVDGFEGVFEYDTGVFPRTAIEALVRGFERFLASCVESPERPMLAHPVSTDDHQSLVRKWSAGARLDTPTMAVHQLFEQQIRANGARTALIHAEGNWSYAQLNHAANVIARELREHGVGPEVVVGVSLERSPQLLAALLGVLKAGGAYLALQPDLPAERLEYMASDSAARLVLCDASGEDAGDWKVPVIRVDAKEFGCEAEDLGVSIDPESLAYILYTSGSTGRPKGVEMRHGPVTNLVVALQERALFTRDDVVLWKTPYGFDMSVSELFNTVAVGACLVVGEPGMERDVEALTAAIRTHQVTVLRMVPTALEMLINATSFEQCSSVRRMICAGEALSGVVARTYLERGGGELYNLLGATETCVDTTFFQFEAEDGSAMVSVGTPLENYRTYVLDDSLSLSPAQFHGELYVGGAGLARGYRAMPSRTALSFVPDLHTTQPGARMYRTGDLAWWNECGGLEYVGRADNQLQVRGIRVELLEVETLLAAVAGVRSAAVRSVNESSGRADALTAYLVFEEGRERTPAELRSELKRNLAEAVIPTRFVKLEAMPRTSSGKIDRNALPEPDASLRTTTRTLPRTATEESIAAIWRERLGLEQVGVHENFFEVGGHSLLAVRLQADLRDVTGFDIPLVQLVDAPTIAELAELVVELELDAMSDDDLDDLLAGLEDE